MTVPRLAVHFPLANDQKPIFGMALWLQEGAIHDIHERHAFRSVFELLFKLVNCAAAWAHVPIPSVSPIVSCTLLSEYRFA